MAKNKQNKCENCQIEKCQICDTSQRICDVCVNGYMLVDGKFTCERQCPNGYYKAKKNSCFQCAEGCHTCSNSINCQICESNFYFFEGKCIKFLNPNNKTIEDYIERCDICLVENYPCPEKTYKNESEFACHRCDQSCIQCKNGAECMECGPNRTLEDGFCYKICPNFTYLNKSSNQCFKCQNFCKICEDFKNCLQCDDHFYLNMNGTCLLGEGYYISMLESENEKSSSFATNVPEIVILEPMEEINDEQLIDLNELEVIEEDTSASESSSSMALVQLWTWFIGMSILTTPWHVLGLLGEPRRISSVVYNNLLTLAWKPYEFMMIFGGLILLGSACLFVYNLAKTQLNPSADVFEGEIEFAEPIHAVASLPEWLNDFKLWNKVIAVLMAISFGYPILQFFFMDTSGSSPWGF